MRWAIGSTPSDATHGLSTQCGRGRRRTKRLYYHIRNSYHPLSTVNYRSFLSLTFLPLLGHITFRWLQISRQTRRELAPSNVLIGDIQQCSATNCVSFYELWVLYCSFSISGMCSKVDLKYYCGNWILIVCLLFGLCFGMKGLTQSYLSRSGAILFLQFKL